MTLFSPAHLFPPTRILASAGSGKTHKLVRRYLGLVFEGADVSTILATTFTRLAAGEIRDRILITLVDAAERPAEREKLRHDLGLPRLERRRVLEVIDCLIRDLHRLEIRTLDSFFASIVQGHAIELGLAADSVIVDEVDERRLRLEAVLQVLDEADRDAFVEVLRVMTEGEAGRTVVRALDDAVAGLYTLHREATDNAYDRIPASPGPPADVVTRCIEDLAALADDQPKNRKAILKDLDDARGRQWEAFLKDGIAKKIAEGQTTYMSRPLSSELVAAYEPVVLHAQAELARRLAIGTKATGDMMRWFDRAFSRHKGQRRRLTFEDLTYAMLDAQRIGRFETLCFRIDARLRHLLLDEFQDTSAAQWRILAPIAQELIGDASDPGTFFCVGDIKQSIYGFRGACPEVLEEVPLLLLAPEGGSGIADARLDRSYRSAPPIIDVVNDVFRAVGDNPALEDEPDLRRAARLFQDDFEEHETEHVNDPGFVELRVARDRDLIMEDAAARVGELHRAHPERSIAVLTRTNKAVGQLLFELGPSRANLPAAGRGGGTLGDTPPVNAILDLLVVADHPDDLVAAFHVARTPLGSVVGLDDEKDRAGRHRVSRRVRRRLVDDGYAATMASWVRAIRADCDAREQRRLGLLLEIAERLGRDASLRPAAFAERLEATMVNDAVVSPIQVMTVHQSKGLEFDIVVLPQLTDPLAKNADVAYEREEATGPVTRLCRWPNSQVRGAVPELATFFSHFRGRLARESLAGLYVAMTRARHGLVMFVPPAKRAGTNAAGILREALAPGVEATAGVTLFKAGDEEAVRVARKADKPPPPPRPAIGTIRIGPRRGGVRVRSARPASSPRDLRVGELLAPRDDEPRVNGRVMHALLQEVEWLDDFATDDDRLRAVARREAPRRPAAWHEAAVANFRKTLARPGFRELLSRGDQPPDRVQAWRERPFARYVGDGEVQTGSIDRLVASRDGRGEVTSAVVIDFKTDRLEAEETPLASERHRAQLAVYREAAAELLGLPPDLITVQVAFVDPGVVETLSFEGQDTAV